MKKSTNQNLIDNINISPHHTMRGYICGSLSSYLYKKIAHIQYGDYCAHIAYATADEHAIVTAHPSPAG